MRLVGFSSGFDLNSTSYILIDSQRKRTLLFATRDRFFCDMNSTLPPRGKDV